MLVEATIPLSILKNILAPSTAHVTLLPTFSSRSFPGSYVPTLAVLSRCLRCCPPLLPLLLVNPNGGPLCPPPHWRWWETVDPSVSSISHRGRVLRSNTPSMTPSEASPSICGGGGWPWAPRHTPKGCTDTCTCPRHCMTCAGPGRLRGGPPTSWT